MLNAKCVVLDNKDIFPCLLLSYVREINIKMVRIPAKLTNERREQVWALMLRGENPQSIKKTLNIPGNTVYKDIKFLTKKSKQYMYDMAKGLHVLSYQRALEGIGLTLSEAWNKFHDPNVAKKHLI